MRDIAHINDPELLKQLLGFYEQMIARLTKELAAAHSELARLRGDSTLTATQQELFDLKQRLAALQQKLFGSSSERRTGDDSNGEQSPDPTSENTDSPEKKSRKQRGHGPRPQPTLPIIDVPHLFDQADLICPHCGKPMRVIHGQEQVSFEVDIIPAQIVLKRHSQQKAACHSGCTIETAEGPQKLIPGGRYSIDFALDVAAARYLEHLPLERLRRRYQRMGLTVSVQTLFDQLFAAAAALVPSWAALHAHLLNQEQLFGDETPWPLFTPEGRQNWYLWSLNAPEAVFYTFADSRSALFSRQLLLGFDGLLQCDGLASYSALAINGGANSTREHVHFLHLHGGLASTSKSLMAPMTPLPIRIGMCWSHARRLFLPHENSFPQEVGTLLRLIRRLFAIDDEADKLGRERAGPEAPPEVIHYQVQEARAWLRPELAAPVVEELKRFLQLPHALPQSGLEKAKNYLKGHWKAFTLFLTEPSLDLHNNRSERSLRGPVVSRKCSYGSHSDRGLLVTAVFYSLFESAKLSGVDPVGYVNACLRESLANPGSVLLPWEYACRQEAVGQQPDQQAA
ncbi:MAG: IS66 family transposase [Myxococcota bacterium]